MLLRNLDVRNGLVNGSLGTIKGFGWTALRRTQIRIGELPEYILVKFDDINITEACSDNSEGLVKIYPVSIQFQGKSGKSIQRTMIPLILSWAITIHKIQGITLNKVVVDLYNGFEYGMEYVALSRVKTLKGLAISKIKYERFKNRKITCPKALAEIQRKINKN